MVKKGLSLEEKRAKILNIYHGTKSIFSLKEIEKAASKQGVVSQTIKDVNQSLVDDGLVDMDKIGPSNFFWSFPSKAVVDRQNLIDSLKRDIAKAEDTAAVNKRKIASLVEERADTEERQLKLRRLQDNKQRVKQLESEYETLKENDPAELEKVTNVAEVCKDGVNRWTDNTWSIKSWMVKTRGMSGADVDKYLQIKADFDHV
uniref:Meiotic nuclear division protein 1 n=1 Tax=Undaria pinnatifida TaxID=74381 RepID=F5BX17_UNDPI|nr:meiotic nuclear division protein 1 [Undaria pinnatifida]